MFDGWDLVSETAPRTPGFQLIEIAGQRFAIDSSAAVATVEPMAPTHVPGTPAWVRGVALWEGQVIPVLATAQRLGLASDMDPGAIRLLQLEVGGEPFLLEIESVGDVVTNVELERTGERLVLGFIRVGGQAIPVLDLALVTDISDEEIGR